MLKPLLTLILATLIMALPGLSRLQVIDRDEARYAQASVQMRDSGEFVEVKFQDEARNKKPVGIYWLQTAALTLMSSPADRAIWVHRIPSVLGAILAVLGTYWAGLQLMNSRAAFISSLLLAASLGFVFEAHIAKTDALLCGLITLALACLSHLRFSNSPDRDTLSTGRSMGRWPVSLSFWGLMGLAVLIKGPLFPAVVGIILATLFVWERDLTWARPLARISGPLLCLLITLPWFILINTATDGQFFKDALVNDFGNKLISVQESHGGLPGLYAATIGLFFWPGSLFLLIGLTYAIRRARTRDETPRAANNDLNDDDDEMRETLAPNAARFLVAWAIPLWIIVELLPTKLPHYLLPAYPALALMCGAACVRISSTKDFPTARRIGAGLMIATTALLCTGLLYAESLYGLEANWPFIPIFIALSLGTLAAYGLWATRIQLALTVSLVAAVLLSFTTYRYILPSLGQLRISQRLEASLREAEIILPKRSPLAHSAHILSPHFTEPSLVYHLGTDVKLGSGVDFKSYISPTGLGDARDMILLVDQEYSTYSDFMVTAQHFALTRQQCWNRLGQVDGFNYSKGRAVNIDILRLGTCTPQPE